MAFWFMALGLGLVYQGVMILWVAGLPYAFRSEEKPTAPAGSAAAFGIFWIEQYRYIGLTMALAGIGLAIWGYVQ